MNSVELPVLLSIGGLCTLCQKESKWICQRCLDLYCSAECQRRDWHRHRYICFPMPGLLPAAKVEVSDAQNKKTITSNLKDNKFNLPPWEVCKDISGLESEKLNSTLCNVTESISKPRPKKESVQMSPNQSGIKNKDNCTNNKKEELLLDLYQDEPCQKESKEAHPLLNRASTNMIASGDDPILCPPFNISMFKSNNRSFNVIVLDTSALSYGYIGCIAETDLKYLINIQKYLSNYTDTKEIYHPKLHEYCLARFENEWYRARVVKVIDSSRYNVVYLDFTNESVLTSEDIRRYPSDLNDPCHTNLCLFDGLPTTLNVDHVNFLKKEITTESKLHIDKVQEVIEQIVVIECQYILKKMRSAGLL
ncbi:uncharacterized protein LOC101462393 [Ceratitis capitata]|uniref:Staphylococcal nuclease domain-containing protein 1 n=1 Tax=Ceratitis capitata TaxID=7213 RepID=W8CBD3_CERCA|nr:uncharacterized protein LOC101462393 [Ceratitis capitata]